MAHEPPVDLPFAWPRDEIRSFCRKWQITELAIFGSALRPDFGTDSDIDLLARFAPGAVWGVFDHVRMEDAVRRSNSPRATSWLARWVAVGG